MLPPAWKTLRLGGGSDDLDRCQTSPAPRIMELSERQSVQAAEEPFAIRARGSDGAAPVARTPSWTMDSRDHGRRLRSSVSEAPQNKHRCDGDSSGETVRNPSRR